MGSTPRDQYGYTKNGELTPTEHYVAAEQYAMEADRFLSMWYEEDGNERSEPARIAHAQMTATLAVAHALLALTWRGEHG
jgi:hypothetical protein